MDLEERIDKGNSEIGRLYRHLQSLYGGEKFQYLTNRRYYRIESETGELVIEAIVGIEVPSIMYSFVDSSEEIKPELQIASNCLFTSIENTLMHITYYTKTGK